MLGGELLGHLFARLLEMDLLQPDPERPLRGLLALRILLGLDAGLHRRLELLPDARHGEEPGGPHLGQIRDHLARVGAAGDREAEHERQVVRAVALRDVGHRQVRHHAAVVGEGDDLVERADRLDQVVVGELDALGRSRGARGVDQGEDVVGLDGAPGGVEVEAALAALHHVVKAERALGHVAVDHHHVLERAAGLLHFKHALEECLLGDEDGAGSVTHQVLDLLGRVGVVDGEGRGAEVHRRGVGEVELRPVGEHDP